MGGLGPTSNDPDIALGCLCWSWPSPVGPEGHPGKTSGRQVCSPTLTRATPSQEGDVPTARIGHAAVVLPSSPLAPTPSSTSSSIFVFGGEASSPSAATCCGVESAPAEYPKLADVYEGSPKGASGVLVWRALAPAGVRSQRDLAETTESDAVRDTPAPMAFHASCAASVRGSREADNGGGDSDDIEKVLLVHGGRDSHSELRADLWAFFPSRLSKLSLKGSERGQGDNDESNGGCGTATGWQRLNPQGQG